MVKNRAIFILSLFVFILTWIASPPPVFAECNSDGDGVCLNPSLPVSCSFTAGSGITTKACCDTSTACSQFRASLASGNVQTDNGMQIWNPEGSCTDGIDTALGCLPYKSEDGQLAQTILIFLAGITGAIALVVMLMATIQIMTAGGNPEQVKKGKELLTGAITGLLFIIFSVTLLRMIAGDIIVLEGF